MFVLDNVIKYYLTTQAPAKDAWAALLETFTLIFAAVRAGSLRQQRLLPLFPASSPRICPPPHLRISSSWRAPQEWGDRSMLATIALAASQSPVGVAVGASAGHAAATAIAVLGGSLLSNRISEKSVGYTGGALFLLFALATLVGVF